MLRVLAVALPALSILLIGACGDDDGGDGVAKYFADFDAASAEAVAQIAELGDKYPDAFAGLGGEPRETDVQQTKDSFGEYVVIFDDTVSRFEELDVPNELRELHDETIDANKDLSAIQHQRLDQLGDASTPEEVDEIFAVDPGFTEAVARTDTLCVEMEDRAAQYDIEIDLDCEK